MTDFPKVRCAGLQGARQEALRQLRVVPLSTTPLPCPVCDRPVMPEQCEPWPSQQGPAPWHVGCYAYLPYEHYVGVNGDDEADAIRQWNSEVSKIKRGDFESEGEKFHTVHGPSVNAEGVK